MDCTDNTDLAEPDLAQLLVLEAGRILEDLTPDLAMALPVTSGDRNQTLAAQLAKIEKAGRLLVAAVAIQARDYSGHPSSAT